MSGRCATGMLMTNTYAGRCPSPPSPGSVLCAECRQDALERVLGASAVCMRSDCESSRAETGECHCSVYGDASLIGRA
jgi:hypothetical protein